MVHVRYSFLMILSLLFFSCSTAQEKQTMRRERELRRSAESMQTYLNKVQNAKQRALDEYVAGLTVEQKIAQLFLVNIEGDSVYHPVEKTGSLYGKSNSGTAMVPGGCLLFSYNIADTPDKVISYTDSINTYCIDHNLLPPYVALDQEGGDVNRLRHITSPLPSQGEIAAALTYRQAYQLYHLQGIQMRALGIQMNLAPVAEVQTTENTAFLGSRSFGSAAAVKTYGAAAVNGYRDAGVSTVLKHFPGNTNTDPHTGLPEITLTAEQLKLSVVEPFSALTAEHPAAVLMSHARTAAFDPDTPACFSDFWVQKILRKQMKFTGLVISDDIYMAALAKNGFPPEQAAILALKNGVDVIMLSEKRFAPAAQNLVSALTGSAADKELAGRVDQACRNIISYKIECGLLKFSIAAHTAENGCIPVYIIESVPAAAKDKSCRERAEAFRRAKAGGIVLASEISAGGK